MKTIKLLLLLLLPILLWGSAGAQTGYIYVHLKAINEQNSTDFPFTLKNSSGATVKTFSLNDQATYDNNPSSTNYFNTLDLGLSHGTGGDGEMWEIVGTTIQATGKGNSGTLYHKSAGSNLWGNTTATGTAVDGAYSNQVVFVTGGNANFANLNVPNNNQIYGGGDATDVTANGGRVAMVAGGVIKVYSNTYTAGTTGIATGGTWTNLKTVNTTTRLDMAVAGDSIAYIQNTSATATTVGVISATTGLGRTLTLPTGTKAETYSGFDIAYDDLGTIYAILASPTTGDGDVFSYDGTSWTDEVQSRQVSTLTGGAAHMVFGSNYEDQGSFENVFSRQVDNAGNIYWVDDDRVKNSSSLNSNGIIIAVPQGTYTLTETMPSGYDLGRYNLYDPSGGTTGNVGTNTITFSVAANEVAFGEYINEKLNPKAIALVCTFQTLQSFDAGTGTGQFGTATQGTPLEGTAYHYSGSTLSLTDDGYYTLAKNYVGAHFGNSVVTADHTGNSGYFLAVNASYSKDEFYRQRVTNLVPGLSYTLAFWAVNMSPTAPLQPNVTFGLQDSLGNIVNSTTTGAISSTTWKYYFFTFTATTSQSDLFLTNAAIGGAGNDLGIDDISLNPIIPVLAVNSGPASECAGSSYSFSNGSLSGGIWTSSNKAVATINPKTGSTSAVAAGVAVLTYTYTNQIGCTTSANSTITVTAPPVITATHLLTGTACIGQTDSLYTNFTTPSTAPYTYAWSASPAGTAGLGTANIQNTTAAPTAAGTYTYTTNVTDSFGCMATASVNVVVSSNVAPLVSATATITSASCVSPAALTLNGGVSGSLHPNYTYVWSGPGTIAAPNSGSISATTYNTTATSSTAGQYKLTVTDGLGCTNSATTTTKAPGQLTVAASNYAATACNNTKDSVYAVASGGTGALTYAWTNTGTGVSYSPGAANAKTGVSFTTAGSYTFTITVTDASLCTATATTPITYVASSGPSVSVNNTAATDCINIAFTLTGTLTNSVVEGTKLTGTQIGPSNGTFPISNAFDGNTGTFYDYGGNIGWVGLDLGSAKQITEITFYPRPGVGWDMVGGVFQGSSTSDFSSGVVTLATITVAPSDAYNTIAIANASTFRYVRYFGPSGSNSNIAELNLFGTASVPYSYLWSGSAAGNGLGTTTTNPTTATPTAAGSYIYTLKVTDANGCSASASSGTQTVNPALKVTATGVNPAFCGTSGTNQLLAIATGGSGTYSTYTWTNPPTVVTSPGSSTLSSYSIYNPVASISGASIGSAFRYNVTVTDNAGCTATANTTDIVVAGSPVISSVTATPSFACATNTTTVALSGNVTGGTTPYTYAWTPATNSTVTPSDGSSNTSPITATATATAAQNYTYGLAIVDNNNCTATGSSAVFSLGSGPVVSLAADDYTVCANPSQLIHLTSTLTTATTAPYSYTWAGSGVTAANTGATSTNTATPATSGTYTVTVTDANGCTASGTSSTVSVDNATPNVSPICTGTSLRLFENNGVSWVWITTSGGRFYPDNTYSVNNDSDISHLQAPFIKVAGNYSVTIVDASGCTGSATIPVSSASCSVLASNVLGLAAQRTGNTVALQWQASNSTGIKEFVVERSTDGNTFITAGKVTAANSSSYHFDDNVSLVGCVKLYYRLKETGTDNGSFTSNIVPVNCNANDINEYVLNVYPNPVVNGNRLTVNYSLPAGVNKAQILVTNITGSQQSSYILNNSGNGVSTITIPVSGNMAAGTYFLRIVSDKWVSKTIKIIKQ